MSVLEKSIQIRGREISGKSPSICVPLVGGNHSEIESELEVIMLKDPDMVEWRADFFEELAQQESVLKALNMIRSHIGDLPLLFTIRSEIEGGQKIELEEDEKLQIMQSVCSSGKIDLIDYELVNERKDIEFIRTTSSAYNVRLILSYHNFKATPEHSVLLEKCKKAEEFGADIVKLAVMSQKLEDVLLLLQVTQAVRNTVDIPLVTMSMGQFGSITRMFGFVFGSAITFGMGKNSSAPGQIPVEDLKKVISIIKKSI